MRVTTPVFQLFTTPLTQAVEQGRMRELASTLSQHELFRGIKFSSNQLPIGLRWNMHPEFGFPRQAFNVYRRRSTYAAMNASTIQNLPVSISNSFRQFSFSSGEEMYITAVHVSVSAGQKLSITPFDRERKNMTGKTREVTQTGSVYFKCPFTCGFTIVGSGTVQAIHGISMDQVANAQDWELIQLVGLPFMKGSVGGQGYHGDAQGYINQLTNPERASMQRLLIGELLFPTPPSLNDPQVPDPQWNAPKSDLYFNDLKKPEGILELIKKCLSNTDDFSGTPLNRQPAFAITQIIKGIHQPGGDPPKDAEARIPVVGTTLLSVTSDSPAALGLGFGTTDFVPRGSVQSQSSAAMIDMHLMKAAATTTDLGFDYMVTAQYVIRPFEKIDVFDFLNDLSDKIEFCALSDARDIPLQPLQAEVFTLRTNRPETRDAPFTEAVKFRWARTALPQGYGVVASYKHGTSSVLNTPYDFSLDAFKNYSLYVPKVNSSNPDEQVTPEDDNDHDKFVMVQPEEELPFKGSEVHKYFVAGWDVFGQWSHFLKLNHIAQSPPKQNPGIMHVNLRKTHPDDVSDLSPNNPIVHCTLEVEIGWNWADRSPKRIEVSGTFFNASNNNPPVTHPNHMSLSAADHSTPVIVISFDSAGNPSSSLGSVTSIINTVETPSDLRKIKLIVDGVQASFLGVAPYAVAYAVYVRGLETVRISPAPEDWSAWSDGIVTRMEDPRPPAATVLPATVLFTALPDATKIGRGKLTWPSAANALGYYVWEASETAIRTVLEPLLKSDFPHNPEEHLKPLSTNLSERATQLRNKLGVTKYRNACQKAFNRISRNMITTTSIELEIPASSKVLTLYQISSINSANIESEKSNVIFFAVPQISKPAQPSLLLRKFKKEDPVTHTVSKGIQIQVLNGNDGVSPAGFNLYRTRNKLISNDVGMKGLPVKEFTDSAWQAHTMRMLDGTEYHGMVMEELVSNGNWRPYNFQAVAIGHEDPVNGIFRGESEASPTEQIFFPPDTPPTLQLVSPMLTNTHSKVFILSSSAPFERIDIGKTMIEIYKLDHSLKRSLVTTVVGSEVKINAADLSPVGASIAATWPAFQRQATNNASGMTRFSVGVKKETEKIIIRIIDPLGRATEVVES